MLSFSILSMVDGARHPRNKPESRMGKFTMRLCICPVHKNPCVSSLNKVSTCRTHSKAVSKKDSASGIIFVLSSVSPCFLWGGVTATASMGLSNLSQKGYDYTPVETAMVLMVPGRETHQSPLIRFPVQQKIAPVSTILVLDKASFCQLRKHQHNLPS